MKGKATSFDIAHYAGVSQSTVSRALRNSPLVNEETRKRVQQIAKELNYKVDKNASNLSSQQSSTIALLFFEDPTSDESTINPFFLNMLGSIMRGCNKRGYDLLVSFQDLDSDWHAEYEDTHKADGLILLGYGDYNDYEEKLKHLDDSGAHFVRWGAVRIGQPGISIGCDNFQGGFIMTRHLLEHGRKQIAFIGNAHRGYPEFNDRYQGCKRALANANIEVNPKLQIDAISNERAGYEAVKQLLDSGEPFDAVFCASDIIAIGVIKALREAGKEIPEDIAVTGYDNIAMAEFIRPTLTTIQQNTSQAGDLLVEALVARINDETVSTQTIQPELILRESCGSHLETE